MKKLLIIALALSSLILAQSPTESNGTKPSDSDKNGAVNIVKHVGKIPYTGRPIMIMFDTDTCPYCKKMRKDLQNDPFLRDVAKGFDLYNIPRDKPQSYTILGNETTLQTLIMLYKVKATPNIVLLTSHGEKIWQLPGYVKPEVLGKIMLFVDGVDKGKYKKSEWKNYLKKNGLI